MRHPLYDSEATSGILKTYWRSIFRWDFGNKLCINFIYPSSRLYVRSQNRYILHEQGPYAAVPK